jgi:PhzF family phenazine biosynthesis protein
MPHLLYQVDAFTDEPFKGNPAAVCLLDGQADTAWMAGVAREMNLSEIAFLSPVSGGWRLRWFTPKKEVDLCGHATLASAKVLFERQPELRGAPLLFKTRSGDLYASWVDGAVELDFPTMPFRQFAFNKEVEQALGFRPCAAVFSGDYHLFEAEDEQLIHRASPDIAALEKLPMPEVIITARSTDTAYDFISRFFAPQLGIAEDPVTGSAHCLLAPYWAEKMGKTSFTAYQDSPRGGKLLLSLDGERVKIRGSAVIIFEGKLRI